MSQTLTSTSKRYLLDTNAAIAALRNEAAIELVLEQASGYVSVITLGELYWGAEKSAQVQDNLRRVDEFAARRNPLLCDLETARWYGKVHAQLRRKGRPIPQNDIWIAATTLQHDLILLTKDQHFQHVDGLTVESW